jgi:uncharacterized membrane protein YebE (DUF533 family)
MFNAGDLLGGLLQSGLRGSSMGRLEHAMGDRGLGGAGGPLGQILSQLGGSAGRSPYGTGGGSPYPPGAGSAYGGTGGYQGGGGGDLLGGLAGLAERYLGGGGARPGGGSNMAIGGLGALAAAILARRSSGGLGGGLGGGYGHAGGGNLRGAIGAGGLALLGMLAMRALRNAGRPTGSGPTAMSFAGGDTAGDPATMLPEEAVSDRTANLVLRAMIEAAKADGQIDPTERQRILGKIQESGADQEEIAFLQQEMDRPPDPASLAAEVQDPAVAAQLYAASLLAITVDTPAEQAYLRGLADRLGLEPAVTAQLHQALGAPAP